jgi:hypothetical protein
MQLTKAQIQYFAFFVRYHYLLPKFLVNNIILRSHFEVFFLFPYAFNSPKKHHLLCSTFLQITRVKIQHSNFLLMLMLRSPFSSQCAEYCKLLQSSIDLRQMWCTENYMTQHLNHYKFFPLQNWLHFITRIWWCFNWMYRCTKSLCNM